MQDNPSSDLRAQLANDLHEFDARRWVNSDILLDPEVLDRCLDPDEILESGDLQEIRTKLEYVGFRSAALESLIGENEELVLS